MVPSNACLHFRLLAPPYRDTNVPLHVGVRSKWNDVTRKFASSLGNLYSLSISSYVYSERHLHERHLLVGHNKAQISTPERLPLGAWKRCCSNIHLEMDVCDRPSSSPLRLLFSLWWSMLNRPCTPLWPRPIPLLLHLIHDTDGHRLVMGSRMSSQQAALEKTLGRLKWGFLSHCCVCLLTR